MSQIGELIEVVDVIAPFVDAADNAQGARRWAELDERRVRGQHFRGTELRPAPLAQC